MGRFCVPWGREFAFLGTIPELLTRTGFPILNMEDFTGNTSRLADWFIYQGREKFAEDFNVMFFQFYECISSLLITTEITLRNR